MSLEKHQFRKLCCCFEDGCWPDILTFESLPSVSEDQSTQLANEGLFPLILSCADQQ